MGDQIQPIREKVIDILRKNGVKKVTFRFMKIQKYSSNRFSEQWFRR
jgi:hypothetical protein